MPRLQVQGGYELGDLLHEQVVQHQPQRQSSQSLCNLVSNSGVLLGPPFVRQCSNVGIGSPEGPLWPAGVLVPYMAGWNPVHMPMIELTTECMCNIEYYDASMPSENRDVFMGCAPGVLAPEGWLGL